MALDLKKKILLVEDDENCAVIAEAALEKYFNITIVNNGHVALKLLEMIKYDAVLMDINLNDPRMDGLQTLSKIKAMPKLRRLKVFAITAFSDAREWYIKQGFEDLILKPLDEEKVVNCISSKLNIYVAGESLLKKAC